MVQCLGALDPSIGVVLVVNCQESESFLRRQQVDAVICGLIERFRNRNVLLSSFQPEVCVLMHKKQNHFPVVMGCTGLPSDPDPDMSERSQTLEQPEDTTPLDKSRDPQAIYLRSVLGAARVERMLGVWLPLPLMLLVPQVSNVAQRLGLSVYAWSSEDVGRPLTTWLMNKLGVSAAVTATVPFADGPVDALEVFQMAPVGRCSVDLTHATFLPNLRISLPPLKALSVK